MLLRTNNQQGAAGKSYGDVPVLNLDFTSGALDPRLTFTSTGTGTIIDSSGTLNYAPHNYTPNSAPIGAVSPWARNGGVNCTQNANISPIGTQTATFCQYPQLNNGKRINVDIAMPSSRFTWSFYAKMIDGPGLAAIMYNATKAVQLNIPTGDSARWSWNGTSFTVNNVAVSATLIPNSDGWWRLSWSVDNRSSAQFSPGDVLSFYIYGDDQTGSKATGSNVSLWGAQVNLGTNLLPYVDTRSTAVFSPRFDYDPSTIPATAKGLLIEEQATNLVRNSLMNAASNIAGTTSINSGRGTIPDFHTFSTAVGGITGNVALVGTDSGLTFCDYRLYGTPSSTGNVLIQFDSGMVAKSSNVTIRSCYLKLSGTSTGVTPRLGLEWSNAAGFVGNTNQDITIGSGSLITQRSQNTYTLPATPTDITTANSYVLLQVTSGTPIDLTLRVAAPQFEVLTQGTGRLASSFIPTVTSSVTRSPDKVNCYSTGFSSWFNSTQGTFVTSTSTQVGPLGYAMVIGVAPAGVVNSSDSIEVYHSGGGNQARFNFDIGGTTTWEAYPSPGFATTNNSVKLAGSYSPTLRAFAANSPAGNGFIANTIPTTYSASIAYAYIGSRNNDLFLNGTIKSLKYYRKALSNSAIRILANTAY